ncbi:signal peptidase I [Gordonia sp. (in: high G+C Gram-positive bacteria)]|uniref:signal peptidase I n=1 Tax=Gordonia sp. (in: high G+C Gram-positive bacteria) TaxID=84139 RepID=UPI003C7828F9
MMLRRGTTPHTSETEILPGPVADDTVSKDDEATPISWWVKTIASWTLLGIAFAMLAALVVIPRLTGSTAYTVLTGSMEPKYPPGTLIVVKPIPGDELTAGDVITFQPRAGDPAVITHRIVSIFYNAQGQRQFVTKGDANKVRDENQLIEDQIRGKLFYSVPYLGRLNSVLSGSTRSIALFAIAGGLGIYALWMWASGLRDRSKPSDTPEDDGPTGPTPPVTPRAVPVCHACGAPQQTTPQAQQTVALPPRPLAYSAVPDPPTTRWSSPEITHPISTIE